MISYILDKIKYFRNKENLSTETDIICHQLLFEDEIESEVCDSEETEKLLEVESCENTDLSECEASSKEVKSKKKKTKTKLKKQKSGFNEYKKSKYESMFYITGILIVLYIIISNVLVFSSGETLILRGKVIYDMNKKIYTITYNIHELPLYQGAAVGDKITISVINPITARIVHNKTVGAINAKVIDIDEDSIIVETNIPTKITTEEWDLYYDTTKPKARYYLSEITIEIKRNKDKFRIVSLYPYRQ